MSTTPSPIVCKKCKVPVIKASQCGNCKKVSYCSRACQVTDFAQHKRTCKKALKRIEPPSTDPTPTASSSDVVVVPTPTPADPVAHRSAFDTFQARFQQHISDTLADIMWILQQRYYDMDAPLPVVCFWLRFTVPDWESLTDPKFSFQGGEITTADSFLAYFVEQMRDPRESEQMQRAHAYELERDLRSAQDIYLQEFVARRTHWEAVHGESRSCVFRIFATSAIDPRNTNLEWEEPLRKYLALGPFKTEDARTQASFEAFSDDLDYLSRAKGCGHESSEMDDLERDVANLDIAGADGVSTTSFRSSAKLEDVLTRFGFLITAIGPAIDEQVEWVETKRTPEEIEQAMHHREVLRIAQGSGFGFDRSAAGA
ncbi:hypothetical protein RQP46_001986 [Phenoliferia psychrophenolica]